MPTEAIIPSNPGQICKIVNVLADENPDDVYIVAEDPAPFGNDDGIYVVNLKELQRNDHNPTIVPQISIVKNDLIVVAENLEEYIKSWNN